MRRIALISRRKTVIIRKVSLLRTASTTLILVSRKLKHRLLIRKRFKLLLLVRRIIITAEKERPSIASFA